MARAAADPKVNFTREFDALAADLVASLDKFKVPAAEKDELLKIVGSTRGDVVEVKGAAKKKAKDRRKA